VAAPSGGAKARHARPHPSVRDSQESCHQAVRWDVSFTNSSVFMVVAVLLTLAFLSFP